MSDEKKKRPVLRFAVLSAAVIVLLLGAGAGFAYWLNEPPSSMPGSTIVSVEKGDSFRTVARALHSQGLIHSWAFLDLISVVRGTTGDLKVGRYKIDRGATTLDIHNLLVSGKQLLVRVTIPDGWTLKQMAERFAKEKIVSQSDFLDAAKSASLLKSLDIPAESAEGFLFPDTYYFPENYPAGKVIGTMAANFYRHLSEVYPDYKKLTPAELLSKVTMASIVEGEYRVPAEAPVIASVFYNRLSDNMRLQSCATVSYVLTDINNLPHQTRLYDKDLWVPSAYNTYRHRGLPPGPISAPGRIALHAAFHPAETNYLYFVLEDPATGKHFFSQGFAAHVMAKYALDNLILKAN
jgi:UPF0755 protein